MYYASKAQPQKRLVMKLSDLTQSFSEKEKHRRTRTGAFYATQQKTFRLLSLIQAGNFIISEIEVISCIKKHRICGIFLSLAKLNAVRTVCFAKIYLYNFTS
jgi:hypothetical protein